MDQHRFTLRRLLSLIWKPIAIVVIVGGVIYWKQFSPILVDQHQIERGDITSEVMGTGTLEARIKVTISPKIMGRIRSIETDQGDQVAAGDVLVQLDDDELRQQVEIAQASLEAARAAVVRLKTDRERSIAVLTHAKREHERVTQLIKRKAVSESDLDQAVEALAIAEAGVSRADAAIMEGKTNVVTAEKTLAYHNARLADTTIVAPISGLIVKRQLDPGDIAVPGTPILLLVSLDQLWISAWIDETEMAHLKVDQDARVHFRSEPDRSYSGKVARLGREADRETREFVVDVSALELPTNWAMGQRAEVFIQTNHVDDVPTLPTALLIRRDGAMGVFVNNASRARWTPVSVGLHNTEFVEVTRGLQVGDVVVTPAKESTPLSDGRRIASP